MWKIDGEHTKLITNDLQKETIHFIKHSSTIYLLSAFVMKSGVEILFPYLKAAAERGADIKILTGDYLYVTQPEALNKLSALSGYAEIRLWKSNGKSFHPKAFIFNDDNDGALIVGSSNLSRSALTSGVEWNLYMDQYVAESTFDDAQEQFIRMFYNDTTMEINPETVKGYKENYEAFHYKHPDLVHTWTTQEEIELTIGEESTEEAKIVEAAAPYDFTPEPRFAQPEALEELQDTYEEGYNKAMVVMATGLGKTYLAAFFAQRFKRVLFIAHREEILHQAKKSFQHVMPDKIGAIYNGKIKEEGDTLFASIFTLSMKKHLAKFSPDEFDLIIIDEFHHASAKSYQNVLQYFQPDFLMGITATPERTDGNDVFAICDGNVAYEMNFIQAIQRGWLSPFHYYGVYDNIDYSKISWLGNRYDEEELIREQLQYDTAQNILKNWKKHKQTRTIGFCSSIRQADFLTNYFIDHGIQAISLNSKTKDISRAEAINKLETKQVDIIFTVDLFNEGVDIPSVDTLLFVRPTESLVVFTQQIGRGLRLHEGKPHCTIIDLIGNYKNADVKMQLFDVSKGKDSRRSAIQPVVPDSCTINMETEAIQLLEELLKKRSPRKERVKLEYQRVKEELGRRPSYWEMHLHGTVNSKEFKQIWKSYAGFLASIEELTDKEFEVYGKYRAWLEEVEQTSMTKSYKMVLLKYMLSRGVNNWMKPIKPEDSAQFFHGFLMEKPYRRQIDFSSKNTKALWEYDEEKVARLIATMPMEKWSGSSKGLVMFERNVFSLAFDVEPEDAEMLHRMTEDVCEYRLRSYFEKKGKSVNQK